VELNIRPVTAARQGNYTPGNAPDELKALPQWVAWRFAERNGKTTKLPMQPRYSGRMARTNDPATWATFDRALRVCEAIPTLDGAGFVFSGDDPYVGTDLDNCRDPETGVVDPWAAAWIRRLGGYAEVSPSGTGVKIIVKGSLPSSVGKTIVDGHEVEIYDRGRFFTITGWRLHGSTAPENSQEAVEELHALMRAAKPATKTALRREGGGKRAVDDGPIPEGMRHATIRSILGSLHDGTRNLEDLAEIAHAVNAERCQPPIGSTPEGDPISDLRDMARWVFSKEPCKRSKPAELAAMIDRLGEAWYGMGRSGTGGKNEVRFARLLISHPNAEAVEDGLRVSLSIRQAKEILSCSTDTVCAVRDRLIERGLLRYDKSEVGRKTATGSGSGAFVLLTPRDEVRTPLPSPSLSSEGGVLSRSRPGAADLETAHYRHMGPVGYSREDSLCWIEAHPGRTVEELANLLGWSRARDLRRHLLPLVERGLVEVRDGLLWTPEAYSERQAEAIREAYSTIQLRGVRRFDHAVGRWVAFVAETGCVASQEMREEQDRERHRTEREFFRLLSEEKRAEAERSCFGVSPVIVEADGDLVNLETGVVVGWIGEPEEAAAEEYDHPDGCECVGCWYERLRESA
jgi:hypothetical protein